jgi:hypothetical protein
VTAVEVDHVHEHGVDDVLEMAEWPLAVHEAGHAVAAHALGHPLNRVEIRPDGSGTMWTGTVGELVPVADAVAALEVLDDAVRRRIARERLFVALCGDAGVGILEDRTHWNGRSDGEQIHAYAMLCETPPWKLYPVALRLLRTVWPAIDTLATELAWLRRVGGARITELLAPHIEPGAWLKEIHG